MHAALCRESARRQDSKTSVSLSELATLLVSLVLLTSGQVLTDLWLRATNTTNLFIIFITIIIIIFVLP